MLIIAKVNPIMKFKQVSNRSKNYLFVDFADPENPSSLKEQATN